MSRLVPIWRGPGPGRVVAWPIGGPVQDERADAAGTGTGGGVRSGAPGSPRISVIITNYNYARFLGATIASVLAQTHDDVECIVVDDGSTDGSLEVARAFPAVEVVAKANGGQVSACIEGFGRATGQIIVFLDSDDRLYPDACAAVAAAYEPAVTLYQFGLDMVDPEGKRVGSYPDAPLIGAEHRRHLLRHGYFPSSPTSGNAFSAEHVRRMLAVAGSERRYFVDGYLIYSAPFFGPVRHFATSFGTYLVHGQNVSLSAGVNRVSAEKSLRNAVWQRTGIVNALRLNGEPHRPPERYLTAWYYRYLLILRRCYGVGDIAPDLSDWSAGLLALGRFLIYPGITIGQRAKNVVLILALLAGDCSLGRRVVPAAAPLPR